LQAGAVLGRLEGRRTTECVGRRDPESAPMRVNAIERFRCRARLSSFEDDAARRLDAE